MEENNAKLFLNNLYGEMASKSNTDNSFKYVYMKQDNTVGFIEVKVNDKKAGYFSVGSAITSNVRNYNGFIYADTDIIYCDHTK